MEAASQGQRIRQIVFILFGISLLLFGITWVERWESVPNIEGDSRLFPISSVQYTFSPSKTKPQSNWHLEQLPLTNYFGTLSGSSSRAHGMWIRFTFDEAILVGGAHAFLARRMSDHYTVYLNGSEIARNFGGDDDQASGVNTPVIINLPNALLTDGVNEISIKQESAVFWNLGMGDSFVCSISACNGLHGRWTFLQRDAPYAINAVIGLLTIAAFLVWVTRRHDHKFGWLAALGALWWYRNLIYTTTLAPFESGLFWEVAVQSIFFLTIAFFCYTVEFYDIPKKRILSIIFSVSVVIISLVRLLFLAFDWDDTLVFALTIPVSWCTIAVAGYACWRSPSTVNSFMFIAVFAASLFTLYDFLSISGVMKDRQFNLLPFGSILVFIAFGFSLGHRLLVALASAENLNVELESRVQHAAATLQASEESRRALAVRAAITDERERLMREIHDGIGSNLVTALSAEEARGGSKEALAVLKRSLVDLRIAVDSLEPVNGDIAALLGGFRYRIERDLRAVGLKVSWQVEDVPAIPWMDPVNALHVLRILQELTSNIVGHSHASAISFICKPARIDDKDGVMVKIEDDGVGFDIDKHAHGRGLTNLVRRAAAIRGKLSIDSRPGHGTEATLWLPIERPH